MWVEPSPFSKVYTMDIRLKTIMKVAAMKVAASRNQYPVHNLTTLLYNLPGCHLKPQFYSPMWFQILWNLR